MKMEDFGPNHRQPPHALPLPIADNQSLRLFDDGHQRLSALPDSPFSIGALGLSLGGLSLNGNDYGHDRYHQSPSPIGISRDLDYHRSVLSDPTADYEGFRYQGSFNANLGRFLGNSGTDHGQNSYMGNDMEYLHSLLCSRNPSLAEQNLGLRSGGLGKGNENVNVNGIDSLYWTHGCSCAQGRNAQSSSQWCRQLQQQQQYGMLLNRTPCPNDNGYLNPGAHDGDVVGTPPKFSRACAGNRRNLLSNSNRSTFGVPDGVVMKLSSAIGNHRRNLSANINHYKVRPNLSSFHLMDLRGKVVTWAKDQYGCRLLQMKFENPIEEEIEMVFDEVIGVVSQLMTHPFANYFIQKLVEVCSEEQRTKIILSLSESEFQLVRICMDSHGTRAVQKLLEHLTTPQQVSTVMSTLRPGVVNLTKDMNGHHVIQHCLKHFSAEENEHLLNEVAENCFNIATDKCGCCVLQLCVDQSKGDSKESLISVIVANAYHLAEDRYGNYVVQHVLGLKIHNVTSRLLKQLKGKFVALSCSKYGSNVIEKCLSESMEDQRVWIVCELLRSPNVSMLLSDPFGNYVIQKALLFSRGATYTALVNLVRSNTNTMRSNLYGKKVLAWIDKRHPLSRRPCEDMY